MKYECPSGNQVQNCYFHHKCQVHKSLSLMSFERILLVQGKIWTFHISWFNNYDEDESFFVREREGERRERERAREREMERCEKLDTSDLHSRG